MIFSISVNNVLPLHCFNLVCLKVEVVTCYDGSDSFYTVNYVLSPYSVHLHLLSNVHEVSSFPTPIASLFSWALSLW